MAWASAGGPRTELRAIPYLPGMIQDIKYAVRSLVFDRGITAIVVLCLALGIGINATLFSMVDGVLIKSLPFAEADRLVILNETFERGGIRDAGVSHEGLQD